MGSKKLALLQEFDIFDLAKQKKEDPQYGFFPGRYSSRASPPPLHTNDATTTL